MIHDRDHEISSKIASCRNRLHTHRLSPLQRRSTKLRWSWSKHKRTFVRTYIVALAFVEGIRLARRQIATPVITLRSVRCMRCRRLFMFLVCCRKNNVNSFLSIFRFNITDCNEQESNDITTMARLNRQGNDSRAFVFADYRKIERDSQRVDCHCSRTRSEQWDARFPGKSTWWSSSIRDKVCSQSRSESPSCYWRPNSAL